MGQARRTSGPHLPGTARLHDRLNAAHSQRPAPEVAQSGPDSHCPPPNHDMQPAPPARPRRRNHRGLNAARKGWTGTLMHHDRFEQGLAIPTSSVHLPFSLSVGFLCDGCGKDDDSLQSNMAMMSQQVYDFCITTIVTLRKWPILSTQPFSLLPNGARYTAQSCDVCCHFMD